MTTDVKTPDNGEYSEDEFFGRFARYTLAVEQPVVEIATQRN